MKILTVDDDPIFLHVLCDALCAAGYRDVTTANSAHEALYTIGLQSTPFDCVLLDIQMPGTNGIELCRQIRRIETYRRTPIVMITSMSARIYIDDAFAAGATDYITKPLNSMELKARIGMVARLVEERRRAELLEHQVGLAANMAAVQFEFEAPVMIPGFERGIEYLALQNYLLTLGIKGTYSVSAFALGVRNAGAIYRKSTPVAFLNMLADVAAILEDALKTQDALIAYAGNGIFVVTSSGLTASEMEDLEARVNFGLEELEGIYAGERMPLPQVRVGEVVRNSIFAREKSSRILDRAIAALQDSVELRTRKSPVAA